MRRITNRKDEVEVKEKNGVQYCMPQKHGLLGRWTFNDWNPLKCKFGEG